MRVFTSSNVDSLGETVLRVVGEVDMASSTDLRAAIDKALVPDGGAVVLDCRGLTFIDASGLGVLVWFANRARTRGRRAVLRNMPTSMQHLLRVTGLQGRFEDGMVDTLA